MIMFSPAGLETAHPTTTPNQNPEAHTNQTTESTKPPQEGVPTCPPSEHAHQSTGSDASRATAADDHKLKDKPTEVLNKDVRDHKPGSTTTDNHKDESAIAISTTRMPDPVKDYDSATPYVLSCLCYRKHYEIGSFVCPSARSSVRPSVHPSVQTNSIIFFSSLFSVVFSARILEEVFILILYSFGLHLIPVFIEVAYPDLIISRQISGLLFRKFSPDIFPRVGISFTLIFNFQVSPTIIMVVSFFSGRSE